MRFRVDCEVTFFPDGMHSNAPRMFKELPGAVTFKLGEEFELTDGDSTVTVILNGKAHTLSRSLFFSAYGSRYFRGLGPMVWT